MNFKSTISLRLTRPGPPVGPDDFNPGPVPGLNGSIALAGGGGHGLALLSDGTVRSWGRNIDCELGVANCCDNGSPTTVEPVPITVGCTYDVIGLQSGGGLEHTMVRRDDWTRCVTGGNGSGQLGDGTTTGTSACGEDHLGRDSSYSLRPKPSLCP